MRNFLLLDDEINVLHALQRTMRQHLNMDDIHIELFTNPIEALTRCAEMDFDLVISDYRMPQMTGVAFLHKLKDLQPNAVRMILSGTTEFDVVMSVINESEVFRYLPKPWEVVELTESVALALEYRDKLLEDQYFKDQLG
jgi:two-component system probable response regulator PhcQ